MNAFGWGAVGYVSLIRLGYVLLGIAIAVICNRVLFPYRRARATQQLLKKYVSTSRLLTEICEGPDSDPQLYYGLVIQAHLQEDKLRRNARDLNWDGAGELLNTCRAAVRSAHRTTAWRQPLLTK